MKTKETTVPSVVTTESVYTARRTLKEWLQALEHVGVLKPGATTRILTSRKLTRIALPGSPAA